MITIRQYQPGDADSLYEIFFNTIRLINIKDYSEQQVKAWAPEQYDKSKLQQRLQQINPNIALIEGKIVGYADVQEDGYVDHFFCHWQFQGQGIGKALMNTLLAQAKAKKLRRMYSHVSITAKPFFEHFGFTLVKQQQVGTRGQLLTNFVMEKQMDL